MDLADLQNSLAQGYSIEEVAQFLCRDVGEVQAKMAGLGLQSAAFPVVSIAGGLCHKDLLQRDFVLLAGIGVPRR